MTTIETRRYDMLLRVQEFGNTHEDQFPATSPGGQAFEALSAVVTQLGEQAVSKRSAHRDGRQRKKAARAALLEHLDKISRFARVIARDVPGFDDKYKLGRLRSDQAILTAARTCAREAALASGVFVKYGLRDGFLPELNTLVEEYSDAVRVWQGARDSHTAACATIERALAEGTAIVRRLDPIVAEEVRDDPGAVAVWERDRHVEPPRPWRRARKAAKAGAHEAAPPMSDNVPEPSAPAATQPATTIPVGTPATAVAAPPRAEDSGPERPVVQH